MNRRTFFEQLAAVTLSSVLVGSQEASGMWGMIAKITVVPGKREEMIAILKESAADMPRCVSYVVAKDAADENVTNFEKIAVTNPVWGVAVPAPHAH